jgi:hypothetical protein
MRFARDDAGSRFIRGEAAAGPGINRPIGSMRCRSARRDFRRYLGAGAETGVSKAVACQSFKRGAISRKTQGLNQRFAIGHKAQPRQIDVYGITKGGTHPAGINVIDTQQKLSARSPCRIMRDQRRPCMPEM